MVAPPLMVRLSSLNSARNLSPVLLDDVSYSNAAPGGFTTAAVKLARPLELPTDELTAYSTLEIIDARSGEQLWWGRLEDPGRASGDIWSLGAVGGSSHAKDVFDMVVYADKRTGSWKRTEQNNLPGVEYGTNESGAHHFAFPRGQVLATNSRAVAQYQLFRDSAQHLAAVTGLDDFGRTTSSMQIQYVGRYGPAADANLKALNATTTATQFTASIGTDFSSLHRGVDMRLIWTAAGATVADDVTWLNATGVKVLGTRVNRFGVELVAAADYSSDLSGITVARIVEDVLGRFLPEYDRAASLVDTTATALIDQLAYEDGTTAQQVLDDLMQLAPTHYWAAWGSDGGRGPRFEWQPWPTLVALQGIDADQDEFDSPGSAADIYNEVVVRWKDSADNSRETTVTASAPALTAAGLTRRGYVDLGSQAGSAAQATTAGQAFLDSHKYPTNSGTVKVSRPIVDMVSGRTLQPWQLKAGVLCQVRNVFPRPDSLNATQDGHTIFRVSAVSYSAKANEASLTLDSYDRTTARALAKLNASASRQRRI